MQGLINLPAMATYTELKRLIEAKAISSFADFFLFVDMDQFCIDTKIPAGRMQALVASPGHMTMDELWTISQVIGVSLPAVGTIAKSDFIRLMQ